MCTQAKFVWGKGEFKKKTRHFLRKFLEKSIWSSFLFLNKMEGAESVEALTFEARPELTFA